MPGACDRRNPLARGGTHQGERALRALQADYFRVDERETSDLILFADRFSRHVRYRNASNRAQGDWRPFFTADVAAVLAALAELPAASFQAFARAVQDYLADAPDRAEADLRIHFKLLFQLPLRLLRDAGAAVERLAPQHPMRAFVRTVMVRDAAAPLRDLVGFYKGALALAAPPINDAALVADTPPALADHNTTFDDADPRIQLPNAVTERLRGAPAVSALDVSAALMTDVAATGWTAFYNGIAADPAPYQASLGVTAGKVYHQIYDALNYYLLATALERLFQALGRIAREATRQLEGSLTSFDGHAPHYGLWLAFLRLFAVNQQHLNGLTQRHLDHYLRDVLRLAPRGAMADRVHLVFELQKNVQERRLPAATTFFRAGKDATNQEVFYRLDSDIVVNRAKVASLMAVHRRGTIPAAVPVADSRDGLGEPLPKESPAWPPFAPLAGVPPARIGFAVADRQLFLREGSRRIRVALTLTRPLRSGPLPAGFRASLTGEKGWVAIGPAKVAAEVVDGDELAIEIDLEGDDPPILPYDARNHGEGYPGTEPMARIEFAFAERPTESRQLYALLGDVAFDAIRLSVRATDVRNVTLQNEAGVLDPAKPFLPFGSSPGRNAPLILGSSELFSKALQSLTLHGAWEQRLTAGGFFLRRGPDDHKARLRHLRDGKWVGEGGDTIQLFKANSEALEVSLAGVSAASAAVAQALENPPYSATAPAGFIRLELNNGFGHRQYVDQKTWAVIMVARDPSWRAPGNEPPRRRAKGRGHREQMYLEDDEAERVSDYNFDRTTQLPLEPYTPKLDGFMVSYVTRAQAPARLLHLHPFGFTRQQTAGGRLFPDLAHEGALYIGVKDLRPPQRLTLLVQTLDGSANPLKSETELAWHYLRGDAWVELAEQAVDDKTRNLTGSGIVGLAVPDDADTDHHVLPSGLHWFRIAAAADTDAVNHVLALLPQAASATLVEPGRDPGRLAQPLGAGTITKLKVSDPAIKKVTQPFPSFGGKPPEGERAFTVRATERLRHKDRASTMWDYEHLVLQEFPGIYKVRCINHTELVRDAASTIVADNEVRPGHVLVVTVPYVRGGAGDPLRPYTDKRTLLTIDGFLRRRISPFVALEVQNPKLEEVQVEFTVAFTPDVADIAFYQDELSRAIVRHLSPWAWDSGAEISFGGTWRKAAIIDFVEEQPYVHHVAEFKMYHKPDIAVSDGDWQRVDEEVVQATTARSILVSHARHVIHGG